MPADAFALTVVDGVVRVQGEIDMVTAPALDHELEALPGSLTLDVSAVTFLDSSGLSVLVRHHQARCEDGLSLRLVEVPPIVRRVLEVTRLLELLTGDQATAGATAPLSYTDERPNLDLAG